MTKDERGQATVEIAFALVFFIFLLFAIVDFGRIFHAYLTLEHAGQEGARMASLGAADHEVVNQVITSSPSLDSNDLSVSISPSFPNRARGTYVTVQLSYPVSFTTPLVEPITNGPLRIQSKTVMRVE